MADKNISSTLLDSDIILDRDIRELFIPYLESIVIGTEYEGAIGVSSQNAISDGENTIVVGVTSETDAINAYNGVTGYNFMQSTLSYRHDRDISISIEINMHDNDALWMFTKYVMMCLITDQVKLTSSGKLKIAQHPLNSGITVKDVGARKIWTSRIALAAKIHNNANIKAEMC